MTLDLRWCFQQCPLRMRSVHLALRNLDNRLSKDPFWSVIEEYQETRVLL